MEILNSTDIIGDEIKEEARKKAMRILKEADHEIENLKEEASAKLAKLKQEQTEIYDAKIEEYTNSVFVTLPLERVKKKISYIEDTINKYSKKYFDELSIDKKLHIVKLELTRFRAVISNSRLIVKCCGFEKEKIKALIYSVFQNCEIKELKEATYDEMCFTNTFEGIIVEDESATFICKAGLEQAKEAMFNRTKEKMAKVLFGGQF